MKQFRVPTLVVIAGAALATMSHSFAGSKKMTLTLEPAGPFAVSASTPTTTGDVMEITDLRPFTHVAYIPVGACESVVHQDGRH